MKMQKQSQQQHNQGYSLENSTDKRSMSSIHSTTTGLPKPSTEESIFQLSPAKSEKDAPQLILRSDSSMVRLSKLNEDEAAVIFEYRKRQLFEDLTKKMKRNNSSSLHRSSSFKNINNNYSSHYHQGSKKNKTQNQPSSPSVSISKASVNNNNNMSLSQCSSSNNISVLLYMDKKDKNKNQKQPLNYQQKINGSQSHKNLTNNGGLTGKSAIGGSVSMQNKSSLVTSNNVNFSNACSQSLCKTTNSYLVDSQNGQSRLLLQAFPDKQGHQTEKKNPKNKSSSSLAINRQRSTQSFAVPSNINNSKNNVDAMLKPLFKQDNQQIEHRTQSSHLQQSLHRQFCSETNYNNYLPGYTPISYGSDIQQVAAFKTAFLETKAHKSKDINNNDNLKNKKCSLRLVKCSSEQTEEEESLNSLANLAKIAVTSRETISPTKQEENKNNSKNKKQKEEEFGFNSQQQSSQQQQLSSQTSSRSVSSSSNSSPSPDEELSQFSNENNNCMTISGLSVATSTQRTNERIEGNNQIKQVNNNNTNGKSIQLSEYITSKSKQTEQKESQMCSRNSYSSSNSNPKNKQNNDINNSQKFLYSTSQGFSNFTTATKSQDITAAQRKSQQSYSQATSTTRQTNPNSNGHNAPPENKASKLKQQSISPASGYSSIMLQKAERSSLSQLKAQTHAMVLRNSSKIQQQQLQQAQSVTTLAQNQQQITNKKNQTLQQSKLSSGQQDDSSKRRTNKRSVDNSPYSSTTTGDQSSLNEEDVNSNRNQGQQKQHQVDQFSGMRRKNSETIQSKTTQPSKPNLRTNSSASIISLCDPSNSMKKINEKTEQSVKTSVTVPVHLGQVVSFTDAVEARDQQLQQHLKNGSSGMASFNSSNSNNQKDTPMTSCSQSGEKSPLKSILMNGKNSNACMERHNMKVQSFSMHVSAKNDEKTITLEKSSFNNINTGQLSGLIDFRPKKIVSLHKSNSSAYLAPAAISQRKPPQQEVVKKETNSNGSNNCNKPRTNSDSLILNISQLKQKSNLKTQRPQQQSGNLDQQQQNLGKLHDQSQNIRRSTLKSEGAQEKKALEVQKMEQLGREQVNNNISEKALTEATQNLYMNYQLLLLQARQSHERMAQQTPTQSGTSVGYQETRTQPSQHLQKS